MSRVFGTVTILLMLTAGFANAQGEPQPLKVLPSLEKTLDPAQVDLGRQLFFDPRLSGDATLSCATCHSPEHGMGGRTGSFKGLSGNAILSQYSDSR